MAARLVAVRYDAVDPAALARFWAAVLGWEVETVSDDGARVRDADAGFGLHFVPTAEPKSGRNRMHFDVTSTSLEDQERTVSRALEHGGAPYDVGQRGDEGHVVLADPEGNEFCVIEPENQFLAGCGKIGALNCEGFPVTGYFWSRALDWRLVWDQDEETAIQSPRGGVKITWSGGPLYPKPSTGVNRLSLELAPDGNDPRTEADRLVSLGATRATERERSGEILLTDPDGNELLLLSP
ncbi:VOC family protein [Myceligenerans pegani]|uniref:VOC family protein n=1 Tax=Myceligenerans pegani TaxID=2776917 RepID=A0ABR9N5A7_9MICO|nr:VOC family protein [Myceligenerans sp. TRM 65318]MBE1878849.1 VOC family protein [Myceligenerans sp. TRM 65318]MBE3021120.1 VOC family protein [Myceligenerans sp. TRM 65318]